MNEQHEAVAESYRRLRIAAQAVIDGTHPAGTQRPLCAIEPYLIRQLRRELSDRHEPQPSAFWMSVQ